jgi:hypothetical protein
MVKKVPKFRPGKALKDSVNLVGKTPAAPKKKKSPAAKKK